jgi:hypothetical protein
LWPKGDIQHTEEAGSGADTNSYAA